MAKPENSTVSGSITVTLSEQSLLLLERIAEGGIFGKNRAEVAARFIDKALEKFVELPIFKLPLRKQNQRSTPRAGKDNVGDLAARPASGRRSPKR